MNRQDSVENLKKTYSTLSNDIDEIQDLYFKNPNQTLARALARSYSAYIEGTLSQLRGVAISSAMKNPSIFTPDEWSTLLERKPVLNKKGEIKHKNCFESVLPMMLFTMKQYVKIHGANFSPNTIDNRWGEMQEFINFRNRLMHPKSESDLEFSQNDLDSMMEAVHWFHDNSLKMLQSCEKADKFFEKQTVS